MKVIFLDFDGTICTRRSICSTPRPQQHSNADPDCIAALNHIIEQTGAQIVVSSTWRIGQTVTDMREILVQHFGVKGGVIDCTPRITKKVMHEGKPGQIEVAAVRGDEIEYWLRKDHREPVESFVILDDDYDMGPLKRHLVQTDFETGLTMEHARRAISILNRGSGQRWRWPNILRGELL